MFLIDSTSRTTQASSTSNPTFTSINTSQSSSSRRDSLVRHAVGTAPNPRAEKPDLNPYVTPADIAVPVNDRVCIHF